MDHDARERLPAGTFTGFWEEVTPDTAVLTEFYADSGDHIRELRNIFEPQTLHPFGGFSSPPRSLTG